MSASLEHPSCTPSARLTFKELKAEARKSVASGQLSATMFASNVSALHNFVAVYGLSDSDTFVPLLGVPEGNFMVQLQDYEKRTAISSRTVVSYRSRLRSWNELASAMVDRKAVLPELLSDALTAAIDIYKSQYPTATDASIARAASMNTGTFYCWKSGKTRPIANQHNLQSAERLEKVLLLRKGFISSKCRMLNRGLRRAVLKNVGERNSSSREVSLSAIKFFPSCLPQQLESFFDRFESYKTHLRPVYNAMGIQIERPDRIWRTQLGATGISETGKVFRTNMLAVVGWLILPSTIDGARKHVLENILHKGVEYPAGSEKLTRLAHKFIGKGLKIKQITPAHLVDPDLLAEFIEWRKTRGNILRSDIVQYPLMLIDPEKGFLTQQVECAWDYKKVGLTPLKLSSSGAKHEYANENAKWAEKCVEWTKKLRGLLRHVARNPGKRAPVKLKAILDHEAPLSVIGDMIEAHKAGKPLGKLERGYSCAIELACWYRDQLLLRMLAANPLRNRNFRQMRFNKHATLDGGANLYKTNSGSWRLHYEPHEFKNERGAASSPYDVEVPANLWALVEVYLYKARPVLLAENESERVFLTSRGKEFEPEALSAVIFKLTERFMDASQEVSGIRTHAFRHIVATAWLRARPEDYLTVSQILHDSLATVLQNYAHNEPNDGLKRYGSWLNTQIKPFLA